MPRTPVPDTYQQVVGRHPDIAIKGAKSRYTAVNGNMFSFVDDQGRLCLRFSDARKAELNAEYGTTDVIQYGAVIRGYVPIPETVAGDAGALQALFDESLAFARSLKPKPGKKG